MTNPITTENTLTGTTAWQVSNGATTEIQAYCDAPSYNPGDVATFFVSTQLAGTTWTLRVYRLGWYQGTGGCLKFTSTVQTGVAQGSWNSATNTWAVTCPTLFTDAATHLQEAGWAASTTWTIPAQAVTGIYAAQFTDANGKQTYCTFVVKGNSGADYLCVYEACTDAAYNQWGGYSLYQGPDNLSTDRGYKASLNRPVLQSYGLGNLYGYLGINLIKWLEWQGYNLAYVCDLDVHVSGVALLTPSQAVIVGVHAEYWSYEMRGAVEAALASGVGLAWMGANSCYWQIRIEASHGGTANRTVVCYKPTSGGDAYTIDPQYGTTNTHVTTQWRDPLLGRPEAALVGVMYSSVIFNRVNVAWTAASGVGSLPYVAGTGVAAGQSYGVDLVGVEYDNQASSSPTNLQIIGQTSVHNSSNVADTQHTTLYRAPSGAYVFASGSIGFAAGLDDLRFTSVGYPHAVPQLQNLMTNVLSLLVTGKRGTAVPTAFVSFAAFHA